MSDVKQYFNKIAIALAIALALAAVLFVNAVQTQSASAQQAESRVETATQRGTLDAPTRSYDIRCGSSRGGGLYLRAYGRGRIEVVMDPYNNRYPRKFYTYYNGANVRIPMAGGNGWATVYFFGSTVPENRTGPYCNRNP